MSGGIRPRPIGATLAGSLTTDNDHDVPRRDAGATLIEILITIVLMGTLVAGILTLTQTSIIASKTSEEAARIESALLTAAERVERADRLLFPCDDDLPKPVEAAAQLKLGVTPEQAPNYAKVVTEHLDGSGNWAPGACPGGVYQPNLVQRITITMTSPETGLTRSLEVIKGDI